jgi:hypothetical protein
VRPTTFILFPLSLAVAGQAPLLSPPPSASTPPLHDANLRILLAGAAVAHLSLSPIAASRRRLRGQKVCDVAAARRRREGRRCCFERRRFYRPSAAVLRAVPRLLRAASSGATRGGRRCSLRLGEVWWQCYHASPAVHRRSCNGAPSELQLCVTRAANAGRRSCNFVPLELQCSTTGAANASRGCCNRETQVLPAGATMLAAREVVRAAGAVVLPLAGDCASIGGRCCCKEVVLVLQGAGGEFLPELMCCFRRRRRCYRSPDFLSHKDGPAGPVLGCSSIPWRLQLFACLGC